VSVSVNVNANVNVNVTVTVSVTFLRMRRWLCLSVSLSVFDNVFCVRVYLEDRHDWIKVLAVWACGRSDGVY
jgi:hypothetical protein